MFGDDEPQAGVALGGATDLVDGQVEADQRDVRGQVTVELDAGQHFGVHAGVAELGYAVDQAVGEHGQHDGVRIPADQLPAHQQHDPPVQRRDDLRAQRGSREAGQVLGQVVFRPVPEPAEVGAALIGRVAPPQQLAAHLVRQATQKGLNEASIALQGGDDVRLRELAEPGQQPVS